MIRETIVPAIPDVRGDNLKDVVAALKSTLDVREGRVGDPLDQLVTLRDLTDLNLAVSGGVTSTLAGGSLPVSAMLPPVAGGYNPATDFTTPPAPTGLRARGGFSGIYLEWNGAPYRNHGYTEIWRAARDALSQAVLVGTTAASLYTDPAEPSTTYYYWIRFVSSAAVTGPYNQTSGTFAATAADVGATMNAISEEILNSQLFVDLSSRVRNIETDAQVQNLTSGAFKSQLDSLSAGVASANSQITSLRSVNSSQATLLTDLSTTSGAKTRTFFQITAPTSTPAYTLAVGDVWFDTDDNNKSYRWSGSAWVAFVSAVKVYYQTTAPQNTASNPLFTGDLWYDSDDNNRPYRWNGTAWQDVRDGFINARVTTLEQTKIGYATLNATGLVFDNSGAITDKAGVDAWNAANPANLATWNVGLPLATAVKQVGVNDGSSTLTLEQRFTAQKQTNNDLYGQYSVKIDNNGYVTGFGISSTAVDSVPFSDFIIRADRFSFVNPSAYKLKVVGLSLFPSAATSVISLQNQAVVTITTTAAHGYAINNVVSIAGVTSDTRWNTSYTVLSVPSSTTFTVQATNRSFIAFAGTITVQRGTGASLSVSSIIPGQVYALCTTSAAVTLARGQSFTLAGVTSDTQWNKDWEVSSAVVGTQFTFPINANLPSPATGSMTPTPWGSMTLTPWGYAQLTTDTNHGLKVGDTFGLSGVGASAQAWNRTWEVSEVAAVSNSLTPKQLRFRCPSGMPASPLLDNAKVGVTAVPFIIEEDKTYIQTALIKDATITDAKITDLTADKITAGAVTAAMGLTTGKLWGGVALSSNKDDGTFGNLLYPFASANFGTGFFLGLDGSSYKFYVGSPTQNMNWNGSALTVTGTLNAVAGSFRNITVYDNNNNVILSSGGVPLGSVTGLGGSGTNICNPRYSLFREATKPPTVETNGTVSLDPLVGYFGGASLKFLATAGDHFAYLGATGQDYNFPLTAGQKYIMSAYVRCSAANASGELFVRTNGPNGTHHDMPFYTSASPGTWQRVSGTFTAPAGTTLGLARLDNNAGAGVSMWFDGIMIEPAIGSSTTPSAFVAPPNFLSLYTGDLGATRNNVYRQGSAPTGASVNDVWFNTSTNAVYYWSGTAWVLAGDVTANNVAASIAGQGALATASSVFIGSTVKMPGGAVLNTADFVNSLSKIGTGNISTFIDGLAITDAYIGNLNAAKINAGTISADRIGAGSITAAKINSTGLEIKDVNGNVILRSGSSPINSTPTFSVVQRWDFDGSTVYAGSVDGFTFARTAVTAAGSSIFLTPTGGDPQLITPDGLNIDGSAYNKIQVRIKRTGGTGWDGLCVYKTNSHGISGSYFKYVPDGTQLNTWVTLEWDMATLDGGGNDWTTSTIQQIRLDFAVTAQDTFEIDWIAIGRYSSAPVHQITPDNASTFIKALSVDTLQIAGEAVMVPRTYESSTTYNAVGTILTYTWTQPEGGKVIVLWQAQTDSARNFRFKIYLNAVPGSGAPAGYYYVGYPNGDYEYEFGSYYYVGAGNGNYEYRAAVPAVPDIGNTRTGGAFEDAPIAIGFGNAVAGSNTVRIQWSERADGSITYQRLIIMGAQR